ncbi:hypothetical protein DID74_00105 [Candidatus Marinamargulisbacteria bacterium SCGC AG-333-B06]|nr:hypothetical protein DID74_00105 [Candidatus Marinamargulisbacteria bacterium SCGC AG-333-B06]
MPNVTLVSQRSLTFPSVSQSPPRVSQFPVVSEDSKLPEKAKKKNRMIHSLWCCSRFFFSCMPDNKILIEVGSLPRPKTIFGYSLNLALHKHFLSASFDGISYPKKLFFDNKKSTVVVGDMEGEIFSLMAAMRILDIGDSSVCVYNDVPYFRFNTTGLTEEKKLVFLGDILDRGSFGLVNLLTLRDLFCDGNSKLEKTFILGNHDLPYLLLSDEDHIASMYNSPSIFSAKGDPNFCLVCSVFDDMNFHGHLKLAEYDRSLSQLTCHAVFTAGANGFLNKFQTFFKQSRSFRDFLKTKIKIEKPIVDMFKNGPDFSQWEQAGVDHDYMEQLVHVINCLIHKDFIKIKDNKAAVLKLLMDPEKGAVESFVFKKGISMTESREFCAEFTKDCFPFPGIRQLNGHWPCNSRDPGILKVNTPFGAANIIKLDCATSSQMMPGGAMAYPTVFHTSPNQGFKKYDVKFCGSGFNMVHYLHQLKKRLIESVESKPVSKQLPGDISQASRSSSQTFDTSYTSVAEADKIDLDVSVRDGRDLLLRHVRSKSALPIKAKIILAEFLNQKFSRDFITSLNKYSSIDHVLAESTYYDYQEDLISIFVNNHRLMFSVRDVLVEDLNYLKDLFNA